jgi:hypothetical protein
VIVGVDFGGPSTAAAQRRKIVAVAAERIGARRYRVDPVEMNARLANATRLRAPPAGGEAVGSAPAPGWTAEELAAELIGRNDVEVVAADFPFSIPEPLLSSAPFAALVGRRRPFSDWPGFAAFVARNVPLAPPLELRAFAPWRAAGLRSAHWTKRATDVAAGAQPPLKDLYQCLFNMTLLGVSWLSTLRAGGYSIVPFDRPSARCAVEVYPGGTMRTLGRRDYKRNPSRAIEAVLRHCAGHGVRVEVEPHLRRRCERYDTGRSSPDPDASDALIALCLGVLHREGLTRELIDRSQLQRRATEGVIWGIRA